MDGRPDPGSPHRYLGRDPQEVLFIEISNRPGALARAVEKLARAKIAIRYAHATASAKARKTAAVIAVGEADLDRADRLLGR